jgi:enterochelin esterase family protein
MIRNLTRPFASARGAVFAAFVFMVFMPVAVIAQPALVSPQVNNDGSVTFRLNRPGAHEVLVALAGLDSPLKMIEADGVWSVTTAPLASGPYWYSYIVDGKSELDPLNEDVVPNYTYLNSVVRVPGSGPEPWERADVPHGELHHHYYQSSIVKGLPNGRSEYLVYTLPGYDPRAAITYPTLYLLHGMSQGAADWTTMGGANFILDNLIAQGRAKPMVVVMPLGYGDIALTHKAVSDGDFFPEFAANNTLFQRALLTEIVPRVEAEYRVGKTRDRKAIAGLSMGASQSLDIGLNRDGIGGFAWVGGFSAPAQLVQRPALSGEAQKLSLLFIGCGTGDPFLEPTRKLIADLQAKGYSVKIAEKPGAHVWPVWDRDLVDFVPLLF